MKGKFRARLKKRSKFGVSEIVGTVILLAVTIVVGFSAWIWAASSAVGSEHSFNNAVAANLSYLNEKYTIVNANFSTKSPYEQVSLWVYNYGNATVYIKQIWISNVTSFSSEQWTNTTTSLSSVKINGCGYCLQVPVGTVKLVTLTTNKPLLSSVIYQFRALGLYGNIYTYRQAG